jgi:hypothetical protein
LGPGGSNKCRVQNRLSATFHTAAKTTVSIRARIRDIAGVVADVVHGEMKLERFTRLVDIVVGLRPEVVL